MYKDDQKTFSVARFELKTLKYANTDKAAIRALRWLCLLQWLTCFCSLTKSTPSLESQHKF